MTKQEQIEEMAKIIDEMYNVYTTTADDIADGLYNAGYRNISEYEAEIKRLEEKCEELLNEKWDAQDDLDCYYDEMPSRINQAVQDFADKVKEKYSLYDDRHILYRIIDELLREYEDDKKTD